MAAMSEDATKVEQAIADATARDRQAIKTLRTALDIAWGQGQEQLALSGKPVRLRLERIEAAAAWLDDREAAL
ncbi:MAG: hypothetical protein KGL39_47590 [Patescibacteria group bacterium]|nr:hypothetical protein [Patescibacteria group bacterium]